MMRVTFNQFEFDLNTKELWRDSQSVPLQPKQADVLCLLIERRESLVSREEIKADAWGDTVVEFDQSINFCIKGIRQALGDNPKDPSFIQTIPRRGYRFIAKVTPVDASDALLPQPSQAFPLPEKQCLNKSGPVRKTIRYLLASGAGLVFAVSAALWWSNLVQPSLEVSARPGSSALEQKLQQDFKRAVHQFEKGGYSNYVSSHGMFANIVTASPEIRDVYAYYGISALYGNVENSEALFKESSELARLHHPDSAMTDVIVGMRALYSDWDVEEAHRLFQKAVQTSPDIIIGWHELAVTSAIVGNYPLAIDSITNALRLDPGSVQERYHAGWFYMIAKDHKNALIQCEQTLELKADHFFSLKCAAESALALGLHEKAKRYFVSFMRLYNATTEDISRIEAELEKRNSLAFYNWLFDVWHRNQAPSFFLASAKASAGQVEDASYWLKQAVLNKERFVPLALAYPEFASLREDPMFESVNVAVKL